MTTITTETAVGWTTLSLYEALEALAEEEKL